MAIRRIHKKQNTTTESSKAPNAKTQSEKSQPDSHYLDIFRSELPTADDVDELVRAIISDRVAKHLVIFYLDEEHRVLAYTIMTVGPLRMASISQRDLFQRAVETGAAAIMLAHLSSPGKRSVDSRRHTIAEAMARGGQNSRYSHSGPCDSDSAGFRLSEGPPEPIIHGATMVARFTAPLIRQRTRPVFRIVLDGAGSTQCCRSKPISNRIGNLIKSCISLILFFSKQTLLNRPLLLQV